MTATKLLLDPGVLMPPDPDVNGLVWTEYWLRLIDWQSDRRVYIGESGFSLALQSVDILNLAADRSMDFPPHTTRERIQAVQTLLSRVLQTPKAQDGCSLDEPYMGPSAALQALVEDLRGTYGPETGPQAIASVESFWDRNVSATGCLPPPPTQVPLCFHPNQPVANELRVKARESLAGMCLRVVGGRPDRRVLSELHERLAIPGDRVVWLPSEVNKKPRLENWKDLNPHKDVAVCITGKIGHQGSDKASRYARNAGVDYFEVERASDLASVLEERYGSS